jgi:hypothetical protein
VDFLVKTLVGGLARSCGPTAPYLDKTQNKIDFVVLAVLTTTYLYPLLSAEIADLPELSATVIRICRSLLPMLGMMQHEGIFLVVNSFVSSLPSVLTVTVPIIFVAVLFRCCTLNQTHSTTR